MHVEETQTPTPLAKHGAWMIVNHKSKGSNRGHTKTREKTKGEVKNNPAKPFIRTKAAHTNNRAANTSGSNQAGGSHARSARTTANPTRKGKQVDVVPVSNGFSFLQDLEGLQETPVFFEKGMAARETPTTMNNWKNNKSKNQTPRMLGTSSSRLGRSANGISASDQIFVFGNFSSLSSNPVSGVREAYRYITGGDSSEDVDWVWKIKTSERCRMFLWLAVKDKLLTNSVRVKRQLTDDGSCMACGETHESVDHILKHCDVARVCWRLTHTPSSFARGSAATFSRWLRRNCSSADMVNGIPWGLTFSYTCWELWKARNRRIFEQLKSAFVQLY
nr:LINE-type retrotransposon LIb DNA [Ipomoea batatas]